MIVAVVIDSLSHCRSFSRVSDRCEAMGAALEIEEELLTFLENVPKATGQPKLDGSPRKMADPDPDLKARNQEVILSYFGFGPGDGLRPTLEELGERYGGLTRERIRQLVLHNFTNHLKRPLPIAKAAADLLETRDLWTETEFLLELDQRQLAGKLSHAAGLLHYLEKQALGTDYVMSPDLG